MAPPFPAAAAVQWEGPGLGKLSERCQHSSADASEGQGVRWRVTQEVYMPLDTSNDLDSTGPNPGKQSLTTQGHVTLICVVLHLLMDSAMETGPCNYQGPIGGQVGQSP